MEMSEDRIFRARTRNRNGVIATPRTQTRPLWAGSPRLLSPLEGGDTLDDCSMRERRHGDQHEISFRDDCGGLRRNDRGAPSTGHDDACRLKALEGNAAAQQGSPFL